MNELVAEYSSKFYDEHGNYNPTFDRMVSS